MSAEKNYSLFLQEMQASVYGMNHFSTYLNGQHLTLFTNHRPLKKFKKVQEPEQSKSRARAEREQSESRARAEREQSENRARAEREQSESRARAEREQSESRARAEQELPLVPLHNNIA